MYLENAKTIVIKMAHLFSLMKIKIRENGYQNLVKTYKPEKRGKNIILVSSGAIALGCKALGLNKKNLKLEKSGNSHWSN